MDGRVCVPNDDKLRKEIMSEAHSSGYTVHPGGTKMYQDVKSHYWWNGMKRDIIEFMAKCEICQSESRAPMTC